MKLAPILFLLVGLAFSGCMKTALNADGSASNGEVNVDLSSFPLNTADSYQPITKSSSWTYNIALDGQTATSTNVITGDQSIFNGKTYYNVAGSYSSGANTLSYYYSSGHVYRWRNSILLQGSVADIPYLIDTVSAGNHWLDKMNDDGTVNGHNARLAMTMVERNITMTVNNVTYQKVMHTKVDFQFGDTGTYTTTTTYDFYIAKGVGIIEMDQSVLGSIKVRHQLSSYSIK